MDRNFARALALVLKSEGGWSDNPADPGGATMKGVTIATFHRYINPHGTKDDLRHITDAQLAKVYREQYWNAISGDQLPDGVDYATFDFAVNSGPGRAAKYLQMTVGVPQDGQIGPSTIQAIRARPASAVINSLCDLRLAFLKRLPTWPTFGKGWSDRVRSVRFAALLIVGQPTPASPASPAPTPPQTLAPSAPAPSPRMNKPAAAASGLVLLAAAIAGFWHHITAFVSNLF